MITTSNKRENRASVTLLLLHGEILLRHLLGYLLGYLLGSFLALGRGLLEVTLLVDHFYRALWPY